MRALALTLLLSGCAGLSVVPHPKEAELHRARTDDGWEISLVRYRAVGEPKGPPVVLCHGISANERNMDLDDEHSMARWFAAHGREAWTMSLRATGMSDAPDAAKGRGPISFDDYWRHDLPAVIEYVQRVSGAPELDFARVTCPIGARPGPTSKEPGAIAVGVAAEILAVRAALRAAGAPAGVRPFERRRERT